MRGGGPRGAEDAAGFTLPRTGHHRLLGDVVTTAHGAGGKATAGLVESVFLDAYGGGSLRGLEDAALLDVAGGARLAFTHDAFVVRPRRFPGGSIGTLAVCGTVNALAVMGARARWLSIAYVLEEGLGMDELRGVAADVAETAAAAGVEIVAGDTKVVERGAADGLYVTTSGIGVVPAGTRLGVELVVPGDRVLVSGPMGDHGVAVMVARGDLGLEADVTSDCAPLHDLVGDLLEAVPATRWLRDATRGGVGTVCCELAASAGLGVVLDEAALPVRPAVRAVCELLGIDPLYVANEGNVVAVVPEESVRDALAALRARPAGAGACEIGEVVAEPRGAVALETSFGGTRLVDMPAGDLLPRIC